MYGSGSLQGKDCFRRGEKGAITVFLALIFLSIVIFAGTIIDIVRIAAAERKVQSALNSAARSVLAGCDPNLMGDYGIYGINTGTAEVRDDFYRYLCVNLKERHKGINFINIAVERQDVELSGAENLLSSDSFKRQVQEYMKYRLPITAADNLIEELQNIKLDKKVEFAKNEKVVRDKTRVLRAKANEVNARLAGIKERLTDISAEKLEDIRTELADILKTSSSIYGEEGAGLLEEYNSSREAANSNAREGECIEDRSEEFADIIENSKSLVPELRECISEITSAINKVRPIIKDIKELSEELADLEAELEAAEGDSADLEQEMEDVQDRLEQLDSRLEEEMDCLRSELEGLPIEGYTLRQEAVQLPDKKPGQLKDFISQKKLEISKVLLKRLEKEWLISAEEFSSRNLAVGEEFSVMDEAAVYSSMMQEEIAEKNNDTIVKSMEKLSKVLEETASDTMEKLSTIEYVMDKYTFLTSRTQRDHFFKKGEVEYIISGSDIEETFNPLKNTEYYIVTNVLLQVWALRFAIDTIEDFVRSTVIFPPQRLAFALAEGALDSSLDMYKMLQGEEIPLCPKSFSAISLKYSDHLKILLFLKPEEEILRKARQLMQINIKNLVDARTGLARSGFRIGDYSTAISASVEAKVNLFFLPMLKVDRLMPDSFEGGRYKIRKQIFMGY